MAHTPKLELVRNLRQTTIEHAGREKRRIRCTNQHARDKQKHFGIYMELSGMYSILSYPALHRETSCLSLAVSEPNLCSYHRTSAAPAPPSSRGTSALPPPSLLGRLSTQNDFFVFRSAGGVWRRLGIGFACFGRFATTASHNGYPLDR